jgi:DNA-binding NtrC family response regulator
MLAKGFLMREKRVLILDDEASIRELCARVLSRAGFAVVTAGNGTEGLKLLQAEAFDLVISDIRMPGISGLDVLEHAKQRYPSIIVVLITGFGTPEALSRAKASGAEKILTKPFNPIELLTTVKEVMPNDDGNPASH